MSDDAEYVAKYVKCMKSFLHFPNLRELSNICTRKGSAFSDLFVVSFSNGTHHV